MKARLLLLVIATGYMLTSCSKKSEEFQESFLSTGKQQTLYGIKYGTGLRNIMDISLPANRNTSTPVVVLVHGGAWVMGDKSYFTSEIQQFAKAGVACATINYRFASDITDVHHPALANDIKDAVDYIASKSQRWQVAPDRFGVCGHSAGGHLSLLTAYTLNDGKIKACGSWAGPVDFVDEEQLKITGAHEVFKAYMGHGLSSVDDTAKYKAASPYWTANSNSVPTLLVYGTEDIGVPYGNAQKMKSRLDSLGIENSLETLTGANHIWLGKDLNKARAATLNWFKAKLSE